GADGGNVGAVDAEIGVQRVVGRLAVADGGGLVPHDGAGPQRGHQQGGVGAVGDGEQRTAIHRSDDIARAPDQRQPDAQVQEVGRYVRDPPAGGAEGGVQV